MPGPTEPWDQPEDPRESTVDLPRIDLAGLADYFRGAAPPPASPVPAPGPAASASARAADAEEAAAPARGDTAAEPSLADPARAVPVSSDETLASDPDAAASRISARPAAPGAAAAGAEGSGPADVSGDTAFGQRQPAPAAAGTVSARAAADVAPARRPDRFAQAGRPAAGSLADLRTRLALLPDGHPSSPWDDSGRPRPLPTRLRQLELGLPAPGREPADSRAAERADRLRTESAAARAGAEERLAKTSALPAETSALPAETSAASLPSAEIPVPPERSGGTAGARPEEGGTGSEVASPASAAERPGLRQGSDNDPVNTAGRRGPQWQDPYAIEPDGHGQSRAEAGTGNAADVALGPWPGEGGAPIRRPGGGGNGNGRNGNGHHSHARQPEHDEPGAGPSRRPRADPGEPRGGPLSRDSQAPGSRAAGPPPGLETPPSDLRPLPDRRPPGPQWPDPGSRGAPDGDTAQRNLTQRNTAQRNAARHNAAQRNTVQHSTPHPGSGPHGDQPGGLIERTLSACRTAEGQNTLGGYGTSGLTPAIRRLAAQLPAGGLAPGSEADTLKPADRFGAKLARLIERNPGRPPEELADSISDAVRYAFSFEPGDYTEGTWLVHRKLKTQGFELEARRNRWESPEYKGIFSRWRDPAHGIRFEVQFHTMASWAVAKRTHDAYVTITDPATSPAERARLRARQVAAAAAAQAPPGCTEIGDFRLELR